MRTFLSYFLFRSYSSLPVDVVSGADVRTCFWEPQKQDVFVEGYRDVFTPVPTNKFWRQARTTLTYRYKLASPTLNPQCPDTQLRLRLVDISEIQALGL